MPDLPELHAAAHRGDLPAVRRLLDAGADPNQREAGDNTAPLHWAAAARHLNIVRALLDAGADVHGHGDLHELDALGWATYFHPDGGKPGDQPEVAALLVARGAQHHIFSAISLGDLELVRRLIAGNPAALKRRLSKYDGSLTPLDLALKLKHRALIDLLSADVPRVPLSAIAALRKSVTEIVPMIYVPDVAAALDWYKSIGFEETARFEENGLVNFGTVAFGNAEIMLNMHGKRGDHDATLWLNTDRAAELYQVYLSLALDGRIEIAEPINDTFYRARQFAIRDLNGYVLYFIQALPKK